MEFINKKYKILNKIGSGSFGSIFKGQNIRTSAFVAIKVESINNNTKLLKNESIIYQYLKGSECIPNVKWFGKDVNNYYMVIDLLGQSLQEVKDKYYTLPLNLVLKIGIKLIHLLKTIHDKGLIHRDIKPENFLFGVNDKSKHIYLIDFGLCKPYLIHDVHIKERKTSGLIGSKTYASINSHNFIEQSRRDDLESLGYLLIYLYSGVLSWQKITETTNDCSINQKILHLKQHIIDMNLPNVLVNYINYVKSLEFNQTPNYYSIIDKFNTEIENV